MAISRRWQVVAASAGLIGGSMIRLGSIATAVAYVGMQGQAYNPLSHWLSALGGMAVRVFGTGWT